MQFTHFDEEGNAKMVDVSGKPETQRTAIASADVYMELETIKLIKEGMVSKGDVLGVARIAGIMAAKKTPDLIPLCHPLNITSIAVDFNINEKNRKIEIKTTVRNIGQTGVEMEALTAASVAALTIYDMCKAVDKGMIISEIMLIEKSGGRSGDFKREKD